MGIEPDIVVVHTLVFIQDCGPVIGQYPLPEPPSSREQAEMNGRWHAATTNPACIAAFWFVCGKMVALYVRKDYAPS